MGIAETAPATIPVTLIGGYLGTGKTTLVNHLLRNAGGKRLAVLVNEFGELPIDADLIEAKDENMISIAGGCVCCSYGNDMIAAMLELSKMDPPPDHVILEASGIAIPGSIASAISILDRFSLEAVVVLANAETIREQISDTYVGDTITRQLADADIVILNKTDLVETGDIEPIRHMLFEYSRGAELLQSNHCILPSEAVLQSLPKDPAFLSSDATPHANLFKSHYFDVKHEVDADRLASQLASPTLDLVRAKGFVKTARGLNTIQIVGRRWKVSSAPEGATPGIVVIGKKTDFNLAALQNLLKENGGPGGT